MYTKCLCRHIKMCYIALSSGAENVQGVVVWSTIVQFHLRAFKLQICIEITNLHINYKFAYKAFLYIFTSVM